MSLYRSAALSLADGFLVVYCSLGVVWVWLDHSNGFALCTPGGTEVTLVAYLRIVPVLSSLADGPRSCRLAQGSGGSVRSGQTHLHSTRPGGEER